jgi:glycerophosphoryl diester phosphodiesterase
VTLVDRRFIERAHSCSLDVHVWTIDDPQEMHRLLDLGVDGIMTDLPAVLRDVMIERGSWT